MNLKPETIKRLTYFIGKACSVFTVQGRTVVIVDSIDSDGLWGANPEHRTAVFFMANQILQINEEIVLNPNNPEHAKIIERYEAPAPPQPKPREEPVEEEVAFVDIQSMSRLARQTKQVYDQGMKPPGA